MNAIDRFLKRCRVTQGRTLIVGSKIHEGTDKPDRRKLYSDATGVDMEEGEGVDYVHNLEHFPAHGLGLFDHVECTSVMEHCRRPWMMGTTLQRMMRADATILVMVPWVWRIHAYPSDFWRFTPEAISAVLPLITWERQSYIVEDELVDKPANLRHHGVRYIARSELIMFGRKCASTS